MKEAMLCDILDLPETRQNIREMYKVGVSGMHESAFAVYQNTAGLAASELLVPDVSSESGSLDEVMMRSLSIDTTPLVTDEKARDALELSWVMEDLENNYDYLDEATQRRVERILENSKFSFKERVRHANMLIESAKARLLADATMRRDVLMRAHNHPQLPTRHTKPGRLIRPSSLDVATHVQLHTYNPGLVDMIVASDGETHHAVVYKKISTDANPELYDEEMETTFMKNLAFAGFLAVVIQLRGNGSVSGSSLPALKNFAERNTL